MGRHCLARWCVCRLINIIISYRVCWDQEMQGTPRITGHFWGCNLRFRRLLDAACKIISHVVKTGLMRCSVSWFVFRQLFCFYFFFWVFNIHRYIYLHGILLFQQLNISTLQLFLSCILTYLLLISYNLRKIKLIYFMHFLYLPNVSLVLRYTFGKRKIIL